MRKVELCPVCRSSVLSPYLETKDHFLTGEVFEIIRCAHCGCLLTDPQPGSHELAHYYQSPEYVSHSVSLKSLSNAFYVLIRKFTLRNKFRLIRSLSGVSSGSILDVGCGSGELLRLFRKKNWLTTGVEPSEAARQRAIRKYHLDVGDSDMLGSLSPATYDAITLWHSLEHIRNLDETLYHLKRLLAPDGILLVAVPNWRSWDASYYRDFWAAWDVPRHLYHFTDESMKALMQRYGMRVLAHIPMKLDAYYVCMLSEKYKTGRQRYLKAMRNGWRSNRNARSDIYTYSSLIYVIKHKID